MAATLAACNNDVTAPSSGTIVGTYALRSVNGIPLPYTFSNGATLSQDVLTLNNDGSFQDISTFTTVTGRTSTDYGLLHQHQRRRPVHRQQRASASRVR